MQQPDRRAWGGRFVRLFSYGIVAMVLTAASCDDPLTKIHPGATRFRVSIGKNLAQSNGTSLNPSISADGRYVVFASDAKNLALPSSNFREIFLRDRQTDTVINVTRLANAKDQFKLGDCDFPFISPSGDWVVFLSRGDMRETGNSWPPVFVPPLPPGSPIPFTVFRWDRVNDLFDCIFDWPDADITNATISDDGRYIAFQTSATLLTSSGSQQIFVFDATTFGFTLISASTGTANPSNSNCSDPTISANGQFIVFSSTASDLTTDTVPANTEQIFVAALTGIDWNTSFTMELVSLDDSISPAPADNGCVKPNISGDGRYVSFIYGGGSLVTGGPPASVTQVIRRDRTLGTTVNAGVGTFALVAAPFVFGLGTDISDDGRFVSAWYPINDNTGQPVDLFVQVQDLQEGKTIIASVGIIGSTAATLPNLPGQALSGDGRWVVFPSLSDEQIIGDNNRVMDIIGFGPMR